MGRAASRAADGNCNLWQVFKNNHVAIETGEDRLVRSRTPSQNCCHAAHLAKCLRTNAQSWNVPSTARVAAGAFGLYEIATYVSLGVAQSAFAKSALKSKTRVAAGAFGFSTLIQVLHPIAVMFQFVRPARPAGRLFGDDWLTRIMKAAGAFNGLPRKLRDNMPGIYGVTRSGGRSRPFSRSGIRLVRLGPVSA
jgi:hypothetical protein